MAMNTVCPRPLSSIQDATICSGTAIVAEGGGQRGIYTAGVLDAFLSAGFNPFEVAVGASAGAQNLSSYFVGLPGYAKRAIAELSVTPSFMVPYRWLGKRGVLDLDMYFSRVVEDPEYRFPCAEVDRLAGLRRLVIVATRKSDLTPIYLEPDSENLLLHMKASSAIPFLYKGGVQVDGEILVDGGVTDPLPVKKAYSLGASRILVIRTIPGEDLTSSWRQRLKAMRLHRAMPSTMSDMLECHERVYNEAMQFINDPPEDVDIVQIAPDAPLQSQVIGSRSDALMADYEYGHSMGEAMLEKLRDWLDLTTTNCAHDVGQRFMISENRDSAVSA